MSSDVWFGFRGAALETLAAEDGCGSPTYTSWAPNGEPSFDEDGDSCISGYNMWYADPCEIEWFVMCQTPNCYRPECQ